MTSCVANKFALLWGFCDIWPFGHIYGSRLGIANKFALLSASTYICCNQVGFI